MSLGMFKDLAEENCKILQIVKEMLLKKHLKNLNNYYLYMFVF